MDKKAFIKYLLSMLLFGLNGIIASNIDMSSYEIVFFRTLIGSLFLVLVFVIGGNHLHIKEHKRDFLFIVLSGIAMGNSWMCLYEAYRHIGVSMATLLYYFGPVIVMILSPIIFKEKFTLPKIIGFLIVIVGLVLINGKLAGVGKSLWGIICGFLSAVTYFFMVTFNKQSKNIVGMENSVIQLVISLLTVSVFIGFKQGLAISVPIGAWGWILLLGVINTGAGCYLYFSSLSCLSVQTVAVCGYLEPLSAILFATLLLHEGMSSIQIIGAICIIGGAMIGELVKS